MIIKVCGLKSEQNLRDITSLNIDMVGYNFYKPSPRYVEDLLPEIPYNIKKVGVFVNASIEEVKQKKEIYSLDYAQLHGDESLSFVEEVKSFIPVIKVFRINKTFNPIILSDFEFCDFFVFDTDTKHFGGSGYKFDWSILDTFDIKVPFLLSGGIGPEDLEIISNVKHPKFAGIDINSKFEIVPGYKDVELIREFVLKTRLLYKNNLVKNKK